MHPDTISKWFPKFLRRHELPLITFHGLRHTSAILLIAEGVPLKNVSRRLGHSNISTTGDIYAHALRSVDQEATEKLDHILIRESKKGRLNSSHFFVDIGHLVPSLLPNCSQKALSAESDFKAGTEAIYPPSSSLSYCKDMV